MYPTKDGIWSLTRVMGSAKGCPKPHGTSVQESHSGILLKNLPRILNKTLYLPETSQTPSTVLVSSSGDEDKNGSFLASSGRARLSPNNAPESDQATLWYQTNPPAFSGNIECRTDLRSPVPWCPILEGERANWIPQVSPVPRNCDKVTTRV